MSVCTSSTNSLLAIVCTSNGRSGAYASRPMVPATLDDVSCCDHRRQTGGRVHMHPGRCSLLHWTMSLVIIDVPVFLWRPPLNVGSLASVHIGTKSVPISGISSHNTHFLPHLARITTSFSLPPNTVHEVEKRVLGVSFQQVCRT